ncbi:liver carboxylesterase-like isoform X2 [Paramacrobiotus metropolitanus]|uniref:liver carboxylesterase-like isoform X2 n=1 Tax=Paramacrobiotus metropolitanus TaxID=2943436 RepID=UPI0024463EF0|nr:liver carboxylesterase-like isoform X2 [Paramacrobiotus metropolitanus]
MICRTVAACFTFFVITLGIALARLDVHKESLSSVQDVTVLQVSLSYDLSDIDTRPKRQVNYETGGIRAYNRPAKQHNEPYNNPGPSYNNAPNQPNYPSADPSIQYNSQPPYYSPAPEQTYPPKSYDNYPAQPPKNYSSYSAQNAYPSVLPYQTQPAGYATGYPNALHRNTSGFYAEEGQPPAMPAYPAPNPYPAPPYPQTPPPQYSAPPQAYAPRFIQQQSYGGAADYPKPADYPRPAPPVPPYGDGYQGAPPIPAPTYNQPPAYPVGPTPNNPPPPVNYPAQSAPYSAGYGANPPPHPGQPCYAPEAGEIEIVPGASVTGEPYVSANNPKTVGYVYYGVRYGTARRFEHSKENQDYSYLRNASRLRQGPICPQGPLPAAFGSNANKTMSEDCLYMDIYVPPVKSQIDIFPVMMWIHGGAFQWGYKDDYNASQLAEETQTVVVTINYRLSVFGFLSTGDDAASGNYGLGDCKLAVHWIKNHIAKFHGDPKGITIFGESAGAFATSAMLLDANVRKSIRASVSFSGSVLIDSVYVREPERDAVELAGQVGCPFDSSKALIDCLRSQPVKKLLLSAKLFESGNPRMFPYALVIDGIHLKDIPFKAVQVAAADAAKSPGIITGYLHEDASMILSIVHPELFNPNTPLNFGQIILMIAEEFLPNGGAPRCTTPNLDLAKTVADHYNLSASDDRSTTLWKLYYLATDALMGYPAGKEVRLYDAKRASNVNGPATTLFRLNYNPGWNNLGAFHTFDVSNIFYPSQQLPHLQPNKQVISSIRKILQDAAYIGRITGSRSTRRPQFFELTQAGQLESSEADTGAMVAFWDGIVAANIHYVNNLDCVAAVKYFDMTTTTTTTTKPTTAKITTVTSPTTTTKTATTKPTTVTTPSTTTKTTTKPKTTTPKTTTVTTTKPTTQTTTPKTKTTITPPTTKTWSNALPAAQKSLTLPGAHCFASHFVFLSDL